MSSPTIELEFTDFNDFWNWYIAVISSIMPNPDKADYRAVLSAIPKLSSQERKELEIKIREYQPIPEGIELVNDDSAFTFFSRYNPDRRRVEICYPTIVRYWVRFPLLIKAVIQHEFGHIINGDIYAPITQAHAQCANICMDIRINQNINREAINQINCCMFMFTNAKHPANTPEDRFGELGIPLVMANKMTWKEIHLAFHEIYGMGSTTFLPKVGDYAILIKSASGAPAGTFCIVTEVFKDTSTCTLEVLLDEIQEAWRGQNYIKLQEIYFNLTGIEDYVNGAIVVSNGKVSNITKPVDALTGLKANEDFIVAIPPKKTETLPKIGDFALLIKDVGDMKAGTYCQVVDLGYENDSNEDFETYPYELSPVTLEAQEAFKARNAKMLRELLLKGNILQDIKFISYFPSDFICVNAPNDQQADEDLDSIATDSTKAPEVGDVIQIKRGPDKGKYGIIMDINPDFTFVWREITKEVALEIMRGRANAA